MCLSPYYDFDLDFSIFFPTSKSTQMVVNNCLLTRMGRVIHPWVSIFKKRSTQRFLQCDKQGGQGPNPQHQGRDCAQLARLRPKHLKGHVEIPISSVGESLGPERRKLMNGRRA